MRKKILIVAVWLLTSVLSVTACGKDTDTTATTMHLIRTEGTVVVSDSDKKDVPLLEDLGLYSGYGVDTLSESYAWINLDDVKLTKMDEESEIAIQKEEKALEIEIISGSLFFNVTEPLADDETMDIRTSTMLVGIRGTCGWVEDRDGLSRAYILEGTVECSAGNQTVQVNAGEMAELMSDGSLVVRTFIAQDIPDFVQVDLSQDPNLYNDIYKAFDLSQGEPGEGLDGDEQLKDGESEEEQDDETETLAEEQSDETNDGVEGQTDSAANGTWVDDLYQKMVAGDTEAVYAIICSSDFLAKCSEYEHELNEDYMHMMYMLYTSDNKLVGVAKDYYTDNIISVYHCTHYSDWQDYIDAGDYFYQSVYWGEEYEVRTYVIENMRYDSLGNSDVITPGMYTTVYYF